TGPLRWPPAPARSSSERSGRCASGECFGGRDRGPPDTWITSGVTRRRIAWMTARILSRMARIHGGPAGAAALTPSLSPAGRGRARDGSATCFRLDEGEGSLRFSVAMGEECQNSSIHPNLAPEVNDPAVRLRFFGSLGAAIGHLHLEPVRGPDDAGRLA